jgi:hypothetical protein
MALFCPQFGFRCELNPDSKAKENEFLAKKEGASVVWEASKTQLSPQEWKTTQPRALKKIPEAPLLEVPL